MKREVKHTLDGKQIVTLVPETKADMAELFRLESQGLLDIGDSLHNRSILPRRQAPKKRSGMTLAKAP
jgi:hypothetical protein